MQVKVEIEIDINTALEMKGQYPKIFKQVAEGANIDDLFVTILKHMDLDIVAAVSEGSNKVFVSVENIRQFKTETRQLAKISILTKMFASLPIEAQGEVLKILLSHASRFDREIVSTGVLDFIVVAMWQRPLRFAQKKDIKIAGSRGLSFDERLSAARRVFLDFPAETQEELMEEICK